MSPRCGSAALALIAALTLAGSVRAAPAHLDLDATLDSATRELHARGVLLVGRAAEEVVLGGRFQVESFAIDGRRDAVPGTVRDGRRVWRLPAADRERRVEIVWHGTLDPLDESLSHRDTLRSARPVAGAHGSFLPGSTLWHPLVPGGLSGYRAAIAVPAGQKALVPGRLVEELVTAERYRARFEFAHPSEGIDLIAGPYRVENRDARTAAGKPVRLRTYFHPEIAALADGYLDAVLGYINLYEGWIGEYPFSEFSVVSSPTPTGFGMPTLTYLGVDVLRLPFIRTTSLGHEVLHSWWGNGVFVEYARGNWSEGLTTFMADYHFKEQSGPAAAREMRLEWLRDFAALPASEDRPLNRFVARYHGASQIVGYNKTAMVFQMLRETIGKGAFDAGIREFWRAHRFRVASWGDLRRAFEGASKRDLGVFFAQWLDRAGAPALRFADAREGPRGGAWRVTATLVQTAPAYRLRVPVRVRTGRGDETRVVDLDSDRAVATFETAEEPIALALDPDFELFRRLAPDEAPPILREVMVHPAPALALIPEGAVGDVGRKLAAQLLDHPAQAFSDGPLPPGPLLAIGLGDDLDAWLAKHGLPARPAMLAGKGTAQAWTATRGDGRTLIVVSARDLDALTALLRPLPHYGRQSWIVFDGAKAIERGVWPSRPQEWAFR
jgi:aminopeptidase N